MRQRQLEAFGQTDCEALCTVEGMLEAHGTGATGEITPTHMCELFKEVGRLYREQHHQTGSKDIFGTGMGSNEKEEGVNKKKGRMHTHACVNNHTTLCTDTSKTTKTGMNLSFFSGVAFRLGGSFIYYWRVKNGW